MRGSARAKRPCRRLVTAVLAAVVVLFCTPVAAPADDGLQQARQELRQTKAHIRAQSKRMRVMQREMNRLATRIARNEALIGQARARQDKLTVHIGVVYDRLAVLQEHLNQRTREVYILGPGAPILYLLTASSADDAVNRISFLDEMSRRDALLAIRVGDNRADLEAARSEQQRLEITLEMAKTQMKADTVELRKKLARAKVLFAQLQVHKQEVLSEISRMHPFGICPVQGPHAIADGFGIWVHHPKDEGGDHIHQGNDIMAAYGTPIVAPFDGLAVTATNHIGGLAVKVYGTFGYVYNAHLSSFGQLGQVQRGDVIGYVGATGNAGGPHDHFEWHPGNGSAVDPFAFLMQVC